jgi:hypothetical protein
MYAFVGKLMGIAIRGKHILNLDLPSIVWKQLVRFLLHWRLACTFRFSSSRPSWGEMTR